MLRMFFFLLVMLGLNGPAVAYEEQLRSLRAEVAGQMFQPGSAFVEQVLREFRYYGQPDIGMNLTAATTYGIADILFGDDYIPRHIRISDENRRNVQFAQSILIQEVRHFLANPRYLSGLWYMTKGPATATLVNRVGATRLQTWLRPAEPILHGDGFNPAFCRSYEDWRTNGCQWYLQIRPDQNYNPAMSAEECALHPFVAELTQATSPLSNSEFVNRAHWYGFLWRRYLEGDTGLVFVWQGILQDILEATRN